MPALREAGVGLYRGMTLDSYIAQIFGNADDVTKGRQMPCHPCDREHHYVVMSSCVSTQVPHAVGIAMAMKIKGDNGKCCFGYMGDGGTSEGDFHVALNFAGVTKAPVVLICQNNQWAISTPGTIQTASETIALKGLGYGVEPLRADGNDVFAVYETVQLRRREGAPRRRADASSSCSRIASARTRARRTIRRAIATRRSPTSGATRRIRCAAWSSSSTRRGWLAAGEREALASRDRAPRSATAIARHEATPRPPRETLIEDVYEEPPWHLREQLAKTPPAAPPGHGK